MKKNWVKNVIIHTEDVDIKEIKKIIRGYLKEIGKEKIAVSDLAENGRCREQSY